MKTTVYFFWISTHALSLEAIMDGAEEASRLDLDVPAAPGRVGRDLGRNGDVVGALSAQDVGEEVGADATTRRGVVGSRDGGRDGLTKGRLVLLGV